MSDERENISKLAKEGLRENLTSLATAIISIQKQLATCIEQLNMIEQTAEERTKQQFEGIKLPEKFVKEFFENKSELQLIGNDLIFSSVDVSKHPNALRNEYFYPFFSCSESLSLSDLNLNRMEMSVEFTAVDGSRKIHKITCNNRIVSDFPKQFWVRYWDGRTPLLETSHGFLRFLGY